MNQLLFGDNLKWLRDSKIFPDASVDLVYLDPPFNSNADYNVLFREESGESSQAQFHAFTDTWNWADAAQTYADFVDTCPNTAVVEMLEALHGFLKNSPLMAYLAMMAPRLVELHRVLKPTGSLYLHCDPTASHYLKMVLDGVFGKELFQNEIIWKRSSAHSDSGQGARHFGRITDTIFFYNKSESVSTWHPLFRNYDEKYVERDYRRVDADGRRYRLDNIQGPGGAKKGNPLYEIMGVSRYWRYSQEKMKALIEQGRIIQTRPGAVPQYKRYLDEGKGMPIQNLWDDVSVINNRASEFLGYVPITEIEPDLKADDTLILKREPDNAHDPLAIIIIDTKGRKLGYVPKLKNEALARLMDAGKLLFAKLVRKEWKSDWLYMEAKVYLRDF